MRRADQVSALIQDGGVYRDNAEYTTPTITFSPDSDWGTFDSLLANWCVRLHLADGTAVEMKVVGINLIESIECLVGNLFVDDWDGPSVAVDMRAIVTAEIL